MRKLKRSEIREMAHMTAECFSDYPTYYGLFRKNREIMTYYLSIFRIYTQLPFTYVTDDKNMIISVKRPQDKSASPVPLLLNLIFDINFLRYAPLSFFPLLISYIKVEEAIRAKYYNPSTDCLVSIACTRENARKEGQFFDMCKEFEDQRPIYCETHSEENVKLYEMMGFEVCEKVLWEGIPFYAMKRKGDIIHYY